MPIFVNELDDDDEAECIENMLPPFAIKKVEGIEAGSADRTAFVASLTAKANREADKRSDAHREIGHIERDVLHGGARRTPDIDQRLEVLNRRIAKSYAESKKIEASKKLEPSLPPHILLEALRELPPGTVLVDARAPVKLGKSENVKDRIDVSRNTISRLTAQRGAIRNALLPKEIAIHRAVTDIKQAAEEAAPDFTPNAKLVRPMINLRPRQGRTEWPTISIETGDRVAEIEDAAAIVKFVMKDALIAAATESISKLYEGNPLVIPEGEREARIAEVDAEILAESRREEALIEIAESKGMKVLRRPNAPPLAVLGVAIGDKSEAPVSATDDLDFG